MVMLTDNLTVQLATLSLSLVEPKSARAALTLLSKASSSRATLSAASRRSVQSEARHAAWPGTSRHSLPGADR